MIRKERLLVFRISLQGDELFNVTELNLDDTVVIRDVGELGIEDLAHQGAGRWRVVCLLDNVSISLRFLGSSHLPCCICRCRA